MNGSCAEKMGASHPYYLLGSGPCNEKMIGWQQGYFSPGGTSEKVIKYLLRKILT